MKKLLLPLFWITLVCPAFAQQLASDKLTATYDGGDIILKYDLSAYTRSIDSVSINIKRNGLGGAITLLNGYKTATSSAFLYLDTTIRKAPGVYNYQLEVLDKKNVVKSTQVWAYAYAPDLRPLPSVFTATNKKGTNLIDLKWKIDALYAVRKITLQRSRSKNGKYQDLAVLANTDSAYTDKVNDANESFYYQLAIEKIDNPIPLISTSIFVIPDFPIVPLPADKLKGELVNQHIVLSWENIDKNVRGFYVKKRKQNNGDFETASTMIMKNERNLYTWQDSASTLVNNQAYEYMIVSETNSFNQSSSADTVSVSYQSKIKALSPPQDLRIIHPNDSVYYLAWTVDSTRMEENLGYQVYIKTLNDTDFHLLTHSATSGNNNYATIPVPKNGDTYAVKSVNAAIQSNFSLPFTFSNAFELNFGPKYLTAQFNDSGLEVQWLNSGNSNIKQFNLYKWKGNSLIKIAQTAATENHLIVKDYEAGKLNSYQLKAVNQQNQESDASKLLEVN